MQQKHECFDVFERSSWPCWSNLTRLMLMHRRHEDGHFPSIGPFIQFVLTIQHFFCAPLDIDWMFSHCCCCLCVFVICHCVAPCLKKKMQPNLVRWFAQHFCHTHCNTADLMWSPQKKGWLMLLSPQLHDIAKSPPPPFASQTCCTAVHQRQCCPWHVLIVTLRRNCFSLCSSTLTFHGWQDQAKDWQTNVGSSNQGAQPTPSQTTGNWWHVMLTSSSFSWVVIVWPMMTDDDSCCQTCFVSEQRLIISLKWRVQLVNFPLASSLGSWWQLRCWLMTHHFHHDQLWHQWQGWGSIANRTMKHTASIRIEPSAPVGSFCIWIRSPQKACVAAPSPSTMMNTTILSQTDTAPIHCS